MTDIWSPLWDKDSKKELERFRRLCFRINRDLNLGLGYDVSIDYFEIKERKARIGIAEWSYKNRPILGLTKDDKRLIELQNLGSLETWASDSLIVVSPEVYRAVIERENKKIEDIYERVALRIERHFGKPVNEETGKSTYNYYPRKPLGAIHS